MPRRKQNLSVISRKECAEILAAAREGETTEERENRLARWASIQTKQEERAVWWARQREKAAAAKQLETNPKVIRLVRNKERTASALVKESGLLL